MVPLKGPTGWRFLMSEGPLHLSSYGGPRGRVFLMSEVPLYLESVVCGEPRVVPDEGADHRRRAAFEEYPHPSPLHLSSDLRC